MRNIIRIPDRSYGIVKSVELPPVRKRNKELWAKDPAIKEAKQEATGSQHFVNKIITSFAGYSRDGRSNIRLTVGKQHM